MANNKYRKHFHKKPEKDDYVPPFAADLMTESVESIGLREETLTLLKGAGVESIFDLVKREEKDFYRIKTFNKKNLNDVIFNLRKKKMFIKPTPPKPETAEDKPEKTQGLGEQKPEDKPAFAKQAQDRQQGKDGRPKQGVKNNKPEGGQGGKPSAFGNQPNRQNPKEFGGKKEREFGKRENGDGRNPPRQRFEKLNLPEIPLFDTRLKRQPKPPTEKVKEPSDVYVKINRNGKWGFADRNGKTVVEPAYDEVFSFHEDLCCVEKNENFGYINRQGEEVIPLVYECASSFSEGLACVFKGGKCGYINPENEVVIEFRFDAGTAVFEGSVRVKKDGKWGEMSISSPSEIRWIN